MIIFLSLFLISKFFHLINLWLILASDIEQYCKDSPEILLVYHSQQSVAEADTKKMRRDCIITIVQYILVILFTIWTIFVIKKTYNYTMLLAWAVSLIQLCELPFLPIFSTNYMLITACWTFSSIFFLTVLTFQTLYQACPILTILLIGLPLRLFLLVNTEKL